MLASPWMLGWVLAALAPVLIHFLLRRRRREVQWSAMRWLQLAAQRTSRPLRLWQWLILFLRASALACIGVAVAQPLGCRDPSTSISTRGRLHLLVVDASMSMQTRISPGQTRWDQAIELAQEKLRAADKQDAFMLVLMRRLPEPILAEPTSDRALVIDRLKALSPGADRAELAPLLRWLESTVPAVMQRHPELSKADLWIASDLQRTTWQPPTINHDDSPLDDQPASFASLGFVDSIEVKTVGEDTTPLNLNWMQVRVGTELPVSVEPLEIIGTLRNSSSQPILQRLVQFWVDGVVRQSQRIDLAPDSTIEVRFKEALNPGTHRLRFEVEMDDLPVDDQFHTNIEVLPRLQVAVIGTRPAATELLSIALAPDRQESSLEVVVGDPSLLLDSTRTWHAIMLCDLPTISRRVAEALQTHVASGSGLVIWGGDNVDADNYNRSLITGSKPPLLPVTLTKPSEPGQYTLQPLEFNHPITAPFADYPQSGLLTLPVFRYWQVDERLLPGSQVVVAVNPSLPLITTVVREDQGRIAFIGIPPELGTTNDTTWSGLAAWPSFPPLVRRLLHWSLASPLRPQWHIGEPLQGTVSDPHTNTLTLATPNDQRQAIAVREEEGTRRWTFAATNEVGQYALDADNGRQYFAVNALPEESELQSLPLDQVTTQLIAAVPSQTESSAELKTASVASLTETRRQLFPVFIAVGLGLLLFEMLVLRQMRRRFG